MNEFNAAHIFAGDPLDRADRERRDVGWIETQTLSTDSKFLPFWNMQILHKPGVPPTLGWLGPDVLAHLTPGAQPLLLGVRDGVAHFALDVSGPDQPPDAFASADGFEFIEPLRIATHLALEDSGTLAHAKSIVNWHATHRFCAKCGVPTVALPGAKERVCNECGTHHFPRTDPVAIMVVHHQDRCLLGRSRRSGTGVFSALAGFIDQGESIEEAVRREVYEEAGIHVGEVRYHSSQPWPYPSSLMIGCIAHALDTEIFIDEEEMAEVRWFSRDEIVDALGDLSNKERELRLPGPVAIAHHLLNAWVAGG
jgi:NAD+ diphosphatase